MVTPLDKLISENLDSLVDNIVKDAIRQIPSYSEAPLRQTIGRVESWLKVLATSIQRNKPDILEQYLVAVAHERREEGYAIVELHTIVQLTESNLKFLIDDVASDQVERNALEALLEAVMGAARMILSVNYVLGEGKK